MVKKARPPQYFTRVVPPDAQVRGSFDQGAITEQKMIGFAGEGGAIPRVGPLYYWAWAHAGRKAAIEPHPHRGFEILSYVLQGTLEHRDSLGHQARVTAGGIQLMRTGSGLEHDETFVDAPTESLQIWLDPHFRQECERPPGYEVYPVDRLPQRGPARVLLGAESPIRLATPDVGMEDLRLESGSQAGGDVPGNAGWAAVILEGRGHWRVDDQRFPIQARDFLVHQGGHASRWVLEAEQTLRVIWIRVPLVLPYALFPKPR